MRDIRTMTTAALVALALLVACSPPDRGPEIERESPTGLTEDGGDERTEVRLLMHEVAFEPQQLTVGTGALIILENRDDTAHTVTHGSDGEPADNAAFDVVVPARARQELRINQAGEYSVTCRLHPEMNMTITVVD